MIVASRLLAGDDTQKAGPLGLLVLIILGIACYFLFRSMSSHLRKVNEQFTVSADPAPTTPPPPGSTSTHATAAADDPPAAAQGPTDS